MISLINYSEIGKKQHNVIYYNEEAVEAFRKSFLQRMSMEFDFAICNKCYEKLFPYLVKQAVIGNQSRLLHEAKYFTNGGDENGRERY
jgi:hypothetical protein